MTNRAPLSGTGALRLESLSKHYGDLAVVDDVSLSVAPGEFLTILGPSGSGKTTTLMMIAGFIAPSGGEILLDGNPITYVPPQTRNLGMVFQNYALFPHMTVAQNVSFPLVMRKVGRPEIETRVRRALDIVQLRGLEMRYPRQLSGGQQQRVALARAFVFEPGVLLMDEPLGALDKKLRKHMQTELKEIQNRLNVTVVYVTHDQEEGLTLSDRIVVMNDGRVEQAGTPADVYDHPSTAFVADFVGDSNLVAGTILGSSSAGTLDVRLADGQILRTAHGEAVSTQQPVQISIRPERLKLAAPDNGGRSPVNRWRGKVLQVTYLGEALAYRVAIGSIQLSVKEQVGGIAHYPRIGDDVDIACEPEHARLLDGTGARP